MITRTLCSDLCSPRICDQWKSFRGNSVCRPDAVYGTNTKESRQASCRREPVINAIPCTVNLQLFLCTKGWSIKNENCDEIVLVQECLESGEIRIQGSILMWQPLQKMMNSTP